MADIPLQVQISMGWFSVYFCTQTAIWAWCDQGVLKRHGPITSAVFHGGLNLLIYRGDVTDEAVFLCHLDDYKCIINKSSPQMGGMCCCADGLFFKGLHICSKRIFGPSLTKIRIKNMLKYKQAEYNQHSVKY